MSKNYTAVDEYYKENQKYEFLICHFLNKNMPTFLVEMGIFFEIQVNSQYNKYDFQLVIISSDRNEKNVIAKIEYEYAAKQIEWDYEIPKHKWQVLYLITRKKYGENFDLFIKSSITYNSIFAIDCRNGFIQKNFGKHLEKLNHNLDFETDDVFYRIYWDDVDKYLYVDDIYNKKLQNGNICIVENNDWKPFYSFIYRRFIFSYLKNFNHLIR